MASPSPEEMAFFQRMRSFMASMEGGGLASISTAGTSATPTGITSSAPAIGPPTHNSSNLAAPASIGPYQSARLPVAPQGFPSSSVNISSSGPSAAPGPFLGFNQLGGMSHASQVNQQRLASAQATLPRAPSLQARRARRTRGPAIHPPSLPTTRKPTIGTTCLTEVFNSDGSTSQGLKIIVKVYPPQVCDIPINSLTCDVHNLFRTANLNTSSCTDSLESLSTRP